jgi:hypothetical protein
MLVTSVSFFNEVATETQKLKRLSSSVSFFKRLPQRSKNSKPLFHFLTSLKRKNYHAQRPLFHFLTRLTETQKLSSPLFHFLTTETKNPRKSSIPRPLFHFLTRFHRDAKTILENPGSIPRPLFHFLTRLPQRHKNYPRKTLFLIMDSKRTMLQNDTMSRDKTRSWLPRGLHWKEETHSGRTPCRGS